MAIQFVAASSQRINLGTDLDLIKAVAAFTFMFWTKPTTLVSSGGVSIAIGPPPGTSSTSRGSLEPQAAGTFQGLGRAPDAGGSRTGTAGALVAGTLSHIAVVCDIANDTMYFYQDGVLIATQAKAWANAATDATNSKNGAIGSRGDGGSLFENAAYEDVRIYNRRLSDAEIQTIHAARGHDGIVSGLEMRQMVSELGEGVAATLAGSNKDWAGRVNGSPVNSPTYQGGNLSLRRRVA